jgi:lysophospholipase L1-like esterase
LATGGAATGGQAATGGKATGGSASGGNATGGRATGGSDTGGSDTGGSGTGGSATGGRETDAGAKGGSTGADAAAGGKTATGGSAAGGTTSTGDVTPLGDGKGSSDGKTPIKVWMAGDSTMSGSGCDGGGWGTQFSTVFNSNVTVVNSSVAGRSIQTWLLEPNVSTTADASGECKLTGTTYNPRWTAMLDASTGMKPGDYLFVEFGINDGDAGCEKSRHVGKALFQTYLTTMAKAASDRGAQAIFLTSTSAIACNGSTAQANRGFGPETKATGATDNVPVIDVTTLSAALYTSAGLCPNSNDYSSTTSKVGIFFCNDHTHFSAEGALQIAQMVAKALKDQGIGLAAYLK